jgi:thiol-disulfide isomerase/thioredoxin
LNHAFRKQEVPMANRCATFAMFVAICLAGSLRAKGQAISPLTLPGCSPSPELRKFLDEKLNPTTLDKVKFSERAALTQRVLSEAIARYPREYEPYRRLIQEVRSYERDNLPALRERFVRIAEEHPDDPLALLLAGQVLWGKDTDESIRLMTRAKEQAPSFPWPHLELAWLYFRGKRADNAKVAQNIAAFFSLCPDSTDEAVQWVLTKSPDLQPKVSAALRARLSKETDPKQLRDYMTLWGLEFRTKPPQEHDAVRKQVASDLKRLEALNPNGDAAWLAFLIKGYKQSGASPDQIASVEDRLLHKYPHSHEAYQIVSERWRKSHKEPDDQFDVLAWKQYDHEYREALQQWIHDYPDTQLPEQLWFLAISEDDDLSEKEGLPAVDAFLKNAEDYEPPNFGFWIDLNAAEFLVRHAWRPDLALELANRAQPLLVKERRRANEDDNLSADEEKELAYQQAWQDQYVAGLVLRAAKQLGKPEAAAQVRSLVETPIPEEKKEQSGYWSNRARLADLENHKQDALAYYQLALQTRSDPPKMRHGRLRDELMDEARALWKELGGTESAWGVWSKPPSGAAAELSEGRWEKPTKQLPVFELADLSGKTWRLKDLERKTVLINLWATWCGPCNAELPNLEKFYERVKDRSDIQVLTFNIDEDLGLVAPYLKDKGYKFPVLPAYSLVVNLLDGYSIPQNWIIDHGSWRWTQIGYGGGSDADFERDLMPKLGAQNPTP